MPRPKGSGVLKTIDGQDAFEIRRALYAGAEPVRARHAELFLRWRDLVAECKRCAERLKTAEGDKRMRKQLSELESARDATWQAFRESCASGSDNEVADKMAKLAEAARQAAGPAAYPWQMEATFQVEIAYLLEGEEDKVSSLAGSKVKITARQLFNYLRKCGHRMTFGQVQKFVRDTLQVTLRNERGKRHDLAR
jgi:hypothetical protein